MVMLLSVCLYAKKIKKHKAISCSCMAGGNLSRSRRKEEKKKKEKMGEKKEVLRTIKQTKKKKIQRALWFLKVYMQTLLSFGSVFSKERIQLNSVHFPSSLLSLSLFFFKPESFFYHRYMNWNSSETILVRNLGFGGAFSSPHPVLCYQTWCPTTTSLDQTSNVLLSTLTTVNYSFIALIFTSDVYFLRLYFTFW